MPPAGGARSGAVAGSVIFPGGGITWIVCQSHGAFSRRVRICAGNNDIPMVPTIPQGRGLNKHKKRPENY